VEVERRASILFALHLELQLNKCQGDSISESMKMFLKKIQKDVMKNNVVIEINSKGVDIEHD
jgi:hypothetical protein